MGVALIVVGPDKLPDLAKSLARGLVELKKTASALKESFDEELAEDGAAWRPGPDDRYPPRILTSSGTDEAAREQPAADSDLPPASINQEDGKAAPGQQTPNP